MVAGDSLLTHAISISVGCVLGWLISRVGRHDQYGDDSSDSDDAPAGGRRRRPSAAAPREEVKMVLVVNEELKMGKGKTGAQCAHAAVGAVERLHELRQGVLLRQWELCGQPKICLRAASTLELRQLAAAASGHGLPTYVVQDAGRTQVAAGSRTVLAIGPAPKSQIDGVTGQLKLL